MILLNNPIIWLIILIVLLVVEVMTLGLSSIWFAGGALIAFLAALLGADLYIQIILFLAVSILLLIFTRPIAVRYLNGRTTATNVDSMIGSRAVVTGEINNLLGEGEIAVNGIPWSARSEQEDLIIEKGKIVEIVKIIGVKAIVREMKGE
ncbi:MAG TPA: NfeD family protein [Candidatus Pelethocola excrementipullorum]|nr:NfeD family protein [Candidatus Pelethocola excrementipullorum]